jgi:hypothetical protein
VQVGAVKIYVAALEALRRKERQDETQFTTKIDDFLSVCVDKNWAVPGRFFQSLSVPCEVFSRVGERRAR